MTSYFLSQPLSQKFEQKGVKSQFDYWHVNLGVAKGDEEYPNQKWALLTPKNNWVKGRKFHKAIHVFDLLLPDSGRLVFGDMLVCNRSGLSTKACECGFNGMGLPDCNGWEQEMWEYRSRVLLSILQSNGDYEGYIESTMV